MVGGENYWNKSSISQPWNSQTHKQKSSILSKNVLHSTYYPETSKLKLNETSLEKIVWAKQFYNTSGFYYFVCTYFQSCTGIPMQAKRDGMYCWEFFVVPLHSLHPLTLVSFAYRWIVHHYMGTYFWSCFIFLALFLARIFLYPCTQLQ